MLREACQNAVWCGVLCCVQCEAKGFLQGNISWVGLSPSTFLTEQNIVKTLNFWFKGSCHLGRNTPDGERPAACRVDACRINYFSYSFHFILRTMRPETTASYVFLLVHVGRSQSVDLRCPLLTFLLQSLSLWSNFVTCFYYTIRIHIIRVPIFFYIIPFVKWKKTNYYDTQCRYHFSRYYPFHDNFSI